MSSILLVAIASSMLSLATSPLTKAKQHQVQRSVKLSVFPSHYPLPQVIKRIKRILFHPGSRMLFNNMMEVI
jgi:hypothetical protein